MFAIISILLEGAAAAQMPLAVHQCTEPAGQELTCYKQCGGEHNPSYGMNQFQHSPGNCMVGNSTDHKMYVTPCNLTDRNQRFAEYGVTGGSLWMMNPEKANKITYCVSAPNCTIINATKVECPEGAPIGLAPCQPQWPGSPLPNTPNPLQVWSVGSTAGGASGPGADSTAWKLAYTWDWTDHPKRGPAKKNSTSCLTAPSFPPVPPMPPTPPLPPASPAVSGDLVMAPCTDDADQELTCYQQCGGARNPSHGMFQFLHHPGSCLNGSIEDKLMHTFQCNLTNRAQRFAELGANAEGVGGFMLAMNPEHENKVTYCITANCTIINATKLECAKGARVGLAPCAFSWAGSPLPGTPDPRQVWTPGATAAGPSGTGADNGAWKLAFTWDYRDHPKHMPAKKNTTSCMTMVQ